MSKYIYYNKKRKLIGLSLIETIVSMWILGIVIVSMLSFMGASVSKQNQLKIQAMSLAKSELQEAELDARNRKITVPTRYTILLLKSSYQTKSDENNESDITHDPAEDESGFYTKYVSDNGKNWTKVDSTNLNIISSNNSGGISSNSGGSSPINKAKGIPFFENAVSNSINPRFINGKSLNIEKYINQSTLTNLFNITEENKTTQECPQIEDITNDDAITDYYGYGIKCFVMKTTFDLPKPTSTTKNNENTITNIPITVDIIWSSNKTQDGHHPINSYELKTEVMIIGNPNY